MDWLYFRCAWCGSVHRSARDAPFVTCPNCGGEIQEIEEPRDALWAGDALIEHGALEPGTPMRPTPQTVSHTQGPLAGGLRDVLVRGTPMLVSAFRWTGRPEALGVVLHVTDAQHLADRAALTVERSEPSPATVRLDLAALGATGEGPNLGLALAALAASARRRCQELLNDPLTPSDTRAVALRIWLADATQQLPALLAEHVDEQ